MRSGLFWKLFLLQVLAAAAVIACALYLSRSYSVRGFAEYLESREHDRVEQLAGELGQAVENGADLLAAFEALPRPKPRVRRMEEVERLPPDEKGDTVVRHSNRVIVRRHVDTTPPLQLQDLDGQPIAGDRRTIQAGRHRAPIEARGKVVGYLSWPRFPIHPEQDDFAHKQARHLAMVAPVALLVAALGAALITLIIVRPIRRLSAGTAALARREFGTRVPAGGRDELGALAEDFNRLAAALEGFDARQRQWLADIAHELRTPLAVLRGETEALLEGVRTFGPRTVESLREEVRRLETLVSDLSLVSLAESGGLRLNLAATDVSALVNDAATRFRARLQERGFEMEVQVEPGLAAQVDSQRLDQVLGNLLQNAFTHAAPPGPVTLRAKREGSRIKLSVSDAGPGVPPESMDRLFDRLFRVEGARTRASGGAGLGLAICRSIVEAHGGSIVARASNRGGLEIEIALDA